MNYCTKRFFLSWLAVLLFPVAAMAQETDSDMLENTLKAAPAAISANATVLDGDGNVIQEGSNGYTCLPDDPSADGNSPMCLDETWMEWAAAWKDGAEAPVVSNIAFAYMLQGDDGNSNIDPNATEPTDDNEWVNAGPHLMLLVPLSALEGMSHDPNSGEPFVMWRDTPLAHVMIPMGLHK